jgi:hypothetical protein
MIKTKNLTISDMIDVKDLIAEHTTMYGVAFDHDVVVSRYRNCILNHHAVGAYENDTLIGICTQYYWETMPVWTFSNLFMRANENAYLSKKMIQTLGDITEHCIKNAEQDHIYEFYYLFRDTDKFSRKNQTRDIISQSNTAVSSRYDFINMHMIKKREHVKWAYLESFLGDVGFQAIASPHNKTLILRRATIKPEFRTI